MQGGFEMV